MEALRAQAEKIKGFLSDGQITQAELDQLPADSPLRKLTNLMDDGKITTDELQSIGRGWFVGYGGFRGLVSVRLRRVRSRRRQARRIAFTQHGDRRLTSPSPRATQWPAGDGGSLEFWGTHDGLRPLEAVHILRHGCRRRGPW